jgi:lipid-A-disaccharide synthase
MGSHLKLCIIAGEHSGDLHGSTVASKIRGKVPNAEIFGMGGARMRNAGVEIIHDMTEIAVVGFLEVLKNFRTFRRIFHDLLRIVKERKPDAVVLIDLPGFNLRFGPKIKALGIPVIYYISPQVWAWGKRRIKKMRQFIDKFFVILPFEVDFYRNEGIRAEFVGHPLIDVLKTKYEHNEFRKIIGINENEKLVALLPGSREQEVKRILPLMIDVAQIIRRSIPDARFIIPAASDNLNMMMHRMVSEYSIGIDVRTGDVYDIMNVADAAVVSSGTATLETAWFGVPFVLVYKMSSLSYFIAKRLAKVDRIGLVNILAGRDVATEYIQRQAIPEKIAAELLHFLQDKDAALEKRRELMRIRELLGGGGAAQRVADGIIEFARARR